MSHTANVLPDTYLLIGAQNQAGDPLRRVCRSQDLPQICSATHPSSCRGWCDSGSGVRACTSCRTLQLEVVPLEDLLRVEGIDEGRGGAEVGGGLLALLLAGEVDVVVLQRTGEVV